MSHNSVQSVLCFHLLLMFLYLQHIKPQAVWLNVTSQRMAKVEKLKSIFRMYFEHNTKLVKLMNKYLLFESIKLLMLSRWCLLRKLFVDSQYLLFKLSLVGLTAWHYSFFLIRCVSNTSNEYFLQFRVPQILTYVFFKSDVSEYLCQQNWWKYWPTDIN